MILEIFVPQDRSRIDKAFTARAAMTGLGYATLAMPLRTFIFGP